VFVSGKEGNSNSVGLEAHTHPSPRNAPLFGTSGRRCRPRAHGQEPSCCHWCRRQRKSHSKPRI